MPTTLLSLGLTHTLVQNQVYALPARECFILSSLAVEVSPLVGGTFAALTGANTTGVITSAAFLRCTTGAAVLNIKAN